MAMLETRLGEEHLTIIPGSLSQYISTINEFNLLKHKEEIYYAKRVEKGTKYVFVTSANNFKKKTKKVVRRTADAEEARQVLINHNLMLVIKPAKKYAGIVDLFDLIQIGNIALMGFVDKYDYKRGTRFSTGATWWISAAMRKAIRRALLDRDSVYHHLASLYDSVDEGERINCVADRKAYAPEREPDFIQRNRRTYVEGLIDMLGNERMKTFMKLRYIFGLTLEQVGDVYNISRERVRQVEARAIHSLKIITRRNKMSGLA